MTAVALLVLGAAVMLLWVGISDPAGGIAGSIRGALGGKQ